MVIQYLRHWELIGSALITNKQLRGQLRIQFLLMHKLPFSFRLHFPLTKVLLHGLPAGPAADVDCGNDLEGLEPLDKTLHLQKAAVLAVRDSC